MGVPVAAVKVGCVYVAGVFCTRVKAVEPSVHLKIIVSEAVDSIALMFFAVFDETVLSISVIAVLSPLISISLVSDDTANSYKLLSKTTTNKGRKKISRPHSRRLFYETLLLAGRSVLVRLAAVEKLVNVLIRGDIIFDRDRKKL